MLVDERGELDGGADGVAVVVHAVGVVGGWQEADAFVEGVQVAAVQVDVFLGADHVSMSVGLETRLSMCVLWLDLPWIHSTGRPVRAGRNR